MDDLSGFSMLELFRLEADTQTAALSAAVLAIESLEHSPAAFESMMRSAHSLKGAARIIGLEPAVRVAHAMEEVFVAAGRGLLALRSAHADVLLEGVDFLASIARAEDALSADGPWQATADALAVRLANLVSAAASAPAEVAPAPAASASEHTVPAAPPSLESMGRVVRVAADSLNRLVGLTGEAVVESRQLRPLIDGLIAVRALGSKLRKTVATLEDRLPRASPGDGSRAAVLGDLRAQADAVLAELTRRHADFEEFARRNEQLADRLYREVLASRMRPLADGIRGFPRLVRDLARSLGKQARLEVRGEQTGVDRDILERLESPLSHLIRNALDHGIEDPQQRLAAGKPAAGTILLEAHHRAGALTVTLADDGAGIDVGILRTTAVERGLVAAQIADQLSEEELLEFLFLPGFSTRHTVTEVSGRGVGLDVVQTMVKAIGGSVRVATEPGRRTVFTLQMPITLSVIRALLVDVAGEPYAFPLSRIERIISCGRADIRTVEGRHYLEHDGVAIGLVIAAQVLQLQPDRQAPLATDAPVPVVVIGDRGRRFGLVVDAFRGERDLQVRPLDPRLGGVADISSASLLENGEPVLIVDVDDLVRSIDALLAGRRLERVEFARGVEQAGRQKRILVVDDSLTVRELERQLLQSRGFAVDVAVDGMDGWNALREKHYDLVVSDVDMPRLDGIGLVSLIRADPSRKGLPFVIVSYKDREEDRLRGLDAGANRYLTKTSFHDESFIHTIIDLVGEPNE